MSLSDSSYKLFRQFKKEVPTMSFASEKLRFKLTPVFFLALCMIFFGLNIQAQTRRSSAAKKQNPKEKQTAAKDKKDKKDGKSDKQDGKATARNEKSKKPTKAELAQIAELRRKEEAQRREAAARAEERRQAALAEQRRREAAAREARERQLAFERGLRTQTIENIANDNTDGEDLEVRRAAISALGNHAGTVVVMEPQTGKVLSIVNQGWAIHKGFKPCSTIKLVTGAAGLTENAINEEGEIRSRSFPVDLDDAIAHSNNSYFQKVGTDLGNSRMISYAKTLGLGEPTGLNVENEYAGKLPYGNNNPRIYSHGDDFEVTPLQLAVLVSEISNGGKKIIPQIPRTSVEKANFRGAMRGELNLPNEKLQRLLPGMIGAVNYGTARRSNASEFNAAGKTGSCIAEGSWVGLFASVAPVVNPKLAIVVITRGSNERGKYASEIAGKVYKALGARFRENGRQDMVAKVPLDLKPHPKVNAKTSAIVDNEEGEDSDEGDVNPVKVKMDANKRANPKKGGDDAIETNQFVNKTVYSAPVNSQAKPAVKSSNLFSPVVIRVSKDANQQQLPQSRPRVVQMNNK
jgi:penicillin-binding protein 2